MKNVLPMMVVLALLFGAALPAAAAPGDNLTYYLDREVYVQSISQALIALEEMARTTPSSQGGQHLNSAYSRLHDAQDAFNSGKMLQCMEYVSQVIQQVELAVDKDAVGAAAVADTLTQASRRAGHEIVQCIYGFTYDASPHIRNAQRSLDAADAELAANRRAAAVRFYHQAVQKAKVVFEGNNLVRPGADEDEQSIAEIWLCYRESMIFGDTVWAVGACSYDQQERMASILDALGPIGMAEMGREMRPIEPLRKLAPEMWLYRIPRIEPNGQKADYFIYFVYEPQASGFDALPGLPDWKVGAL